MAREIKYYIVAANALPEIFVKVAEAKRMMQTGEADTVGAATKQVGISRSAFYKYKDAVQPFNDMKAEHIITFYCMLKDNTGVLSSVLSVFATSGANILTINQSIPTNGCAAVTISAETSGLAETLEKLMADETVCWAEVTRLARDADGQGYMVLMLPRDIDKGIKAGGEKCVIYGSEADADTPNLHLMSLMGPAGALRDLQH